MKVNCKDEAHVHKPQGQGELLPPQTVLEAVFCPSVPVPHNISPSSKGGFPPHPGPLPLGLLWGVRRGACKPQVGMAGNSPEKGFSGGGLSGGVMGGARLAPYGRGHPPSSPSAESDSSWRPRIPAGTQHPLLQSGSWRAWALLCSVSWSRIQTHTSLAGRREEQPGPTPT